MIFSLKSWSVITKDCPTNILVEITEVNPLATKDDESDGPSFDRAISEIEDLNFHIAQVKLNSTENSQCNYVGKGPFGRYLSITLEGSLKENAKTPARAVYTIGNNYVFLIPLEQINTHGIVAKKNKKMKVYYPGQSCYYGCTIKYVPVAIANNVNIN